MSTNAVSLTTGLILGMRLLGKAESFADVVRMLLMSLNSVQLPEQVKGSNLICLDRGYLGPSLIEYLLRCGFQLLGTHKGMKSFPFVFGNVQGSLGDRRYVRLCYNQVNLSKNADWVLKMDVNLFMWQIKNMVIGFCRRSPTEVEEDI